MGEIHDQTEPIVIFQLFVNPYQGTYQMQKQSVLFQFQSMNINIYLGHNVKIYLGHNVKMLIFGYSGGPEWPFNNRICPILLPSYPRMLSSHVAICM